VKKQLFQKFCPFLAKTLVLKGKVLETIRAIREEELRKEGDGLSMNPLTNNKNLFTNTIAVSSFFRFFLKKRGKLFFKDVCCGSKSLLFLTNKLSPLRSLELKKRLPQNKKTSFAVG